MFKSLTRPQCKRYGVVMKIQVSPKKIDNIYKTSILQQSAFWSKVKRRQGVGSAAFEIKTAAAEIEPSADRAGFINDDLLVLFQPIGRGYHIGYIPYGPKIHPGEENQGAFLEELSESLRPYLPEKCVMLRYDLTWESPWARDSAFFDCSGDWIGPPAKVNQELRLNFNTRNWNLLKANTDILPTDTVFIDLQKDSASLLKEMKPKTRYNVRLAQRRGIRVRSAGTEDLPIWYGLYRETCSRNQIYRQGMDYFEAVLRTRGAGTRSPARVELLIAELDRRPIAAMFLAMSNKRATYLYGASSSRNRECMATYALQWSAIRNARADGCTEYDMFGVSPLPDPSHPLYGLYRFKTGFGGSLFHRMGCWDYPLQPDRYQIYLTLEMKSQGYHLS